MREDGSSKRLSFEESRNVALLMFTCIRMLLILIYVLYKSKSLTILKKSFLQNTIFNYLFPNKQKLPYN